MKHRFYLFFWIHAEATRFTTLQHWIVVVAIVVVVFAIGWLGLVTREEKSGLKWKQLANRTHHGKYQTGGQRATGHGIYVKMVQERRSQFAHPKLTVEVQTFTDSSMIRLKYNDNLQRNRQSDTGYVCTIQYIDSYGLTELRKCYS